MTPKLAALRAGLKARPESMARGAPDPESAIRVAVLSRAQAHSGQERLA